MIITRDKAAEEIRLMWQARALLSSKDKMQRVLLVAIAKEYPAAFKTLLRAIGITDINRPFLCSYATIAPSGRIVCDMIEKSGIKRTVAVYQNENEFIYDMRKLADEIKLDDKDRTEMFTVLQKWITKDQRVGVFGERVAS